MFTSKFGITSFLILVRLDIFASFLQYFLVKMTRKNPNLFSITKLDKRQL